jgi:hypothetical protein
VKIKGSPATVTAKAEARKLAWVQGIIRYFATMFRGRTMDMESNSSLAEENQLCVEKTSEIFALTNVNGGSEPKKPTKVLFILFE